MFSNAIYEALKIFKPIYTLGLNLDTSGINRFFVASVKIFPTHEPLDHVLDVEKKEIFFSKVRNPGRYRCDY